MQRRRQEQLCRGYLLAPNTGATRLDQCGNQQVQHFILNVLERYRTSCRSWLQASAPHVFAYLNALPLVQAAPALD
jgi:hypothetical protein